MSLYFRQAYFDKIKGFLKSDLIKVITGIRRCGKSSFLQTVMERVQTEGNVISIHLDRHGFKHIKTANALEQAIQERIKPGLNFLFIDEIQNVKGFEEVINAYREEGVSIFITGSNSYFLSGELITKLTGRYIEIEMLPLSFHEYLEMKKHLQKEVRSSAEEFQTYIRYGGFPQVLYFDDPKDKELYAQNVVQQIMDRDIKGRRIKNKDVFERILTYLINNFGAPTSLTSLKNYLKTNEKIDIKRETLSRYINILTDAKILYPCLRFDLKSKRSLKAEQKYYLADLSIYFSRNVDAQIHYGPVLENVIYTTLRAKGYFVSVGKIGHLECDFICRKNNQYAYFQIAMHLTNQKTEDREYAPLLSIKDNWPKYLLTLDLLLQERAGILHKNMIDCLEKDIDFL